MAKSSIDSLKMRAKLLQKAKLKNGQEIQLKDALNLVATASGYESWRILKTDFEKSELFNPPQWSSMWKIWFSNLEEARLTLAETGGYLLPYRKQFFICDHNYVEALGLDVEDKDLKLIGRDWTRPMDEGAFKRLKARINDYIKAV